jgi:hypothetical protein
MLLLVLAATAHAQTSYPMITHVHPVAVQRGKTSEVTVEGQQNFAGTYKALFEGTGLSAEIVEQPAPKTDAQKPIVRTVKLKLTAAADTALGVREFRVASPLGVSSVGQFVVVDDPVVVESGDNNTREKANPVPVPSVVCGRIEAAEDVDFFKFHADAGQTLTFEVHCARLQDKIHDLQKHADPILTLCDAEGRELAANDDYFFADPMLSYTFKQAGDYFIQVRDSKYDGDPRWVYALAITNKPYVAHVFPMAGTPGQTIQVEPVGSAGAVQARVPLKVPAELGVQTLSLDLAGAKTNPTAFIVSSLPQVIEQEPNDTPEQATRITLPCGINGRIGSKRDLDHFVFHATKGQVIRFEVFARRFGTVLQSGLDSFIDIMTPKGQVLASNDDMLPIIALPGRRATGKDSGLVFTTATDGDYVLRIRDLHSRGGPNFVYYIEATWAAPDFYVTCDGDKAMIGPGSSATWFIALTRLNGFAGPVQIDVKGLPPGITASALTIAPSMTQGAIILSAAAGSRPDVANVQVTSTALLRSLEGKEETVTRPVQPMQEIYFPGGGRGVFEVNMQTVGITEPMDILKVDVKPRTITLKPGEEVRLDITIQRRPDYDKGVSLDIPLAHLGSVYGNPLPPGVTIVPGKSKTLLGNGSQGHIVLKAAPTAAPIDNVPISVLAHVSVNFVVKVSYSSEPILLTIQK